MRDYPSIPNVFRVSGSSTSINNIPESNNHQQPNYHNSSGINSNTNNSSNCNKNNSNGNSNSNSNGNGNTTCSNKNHLKSLSMMPLEDNGNSDNNIEGSFNSHLNQQNYSNYNRGNSVGLQYLSSENVNRKPTSIVKNPNKNNTGGNGQNLSGNLSGNNGNGNGLIAINNNNTNNNNNNNNNNNSNNYINTNNNMNNSNSTITQNRPTMRNMKCMNNNKSSGNVSGTNPYSHSGVGINTISGGNYISSTNSTAMAMAMTSADAMSTRVNPNANNNSMSLDRTETYPRKFLSTYGGGGSGDGAGGVDKNNASGNANSRNENGRIGGCDVGPNSLGSDLNMSINSFDDMSTTTYPFGSRKYTNEKSGGYCLWIMTPVAASFSVAIVIAALAGPQWLYTEEKLPNTNYNGTANFNVKDDGAFITKYTKSSLWIICSALQGMESSYNCIKIDYFPKEGYQPDPHDSSPAIPYTITTACPFFLVSGVFLLISFIVFLVPTCSHQNNLYYFAAGIMFIVSGLFMLIGLITYISILKAEIGSKLRPKSSLQPALFKVSYGQSFFLFVFGFISTEFVGVLNIFLYISLQQVGQFKRLSCLSFMNIPEKTGDLENKQQTKRVMIDEDMSRYACKKHSLSSNLFFSNDLERRYYFEKPTKCDLHSKNLAKSLNELYTEPAPNFSSFELPQEFPLTRSVSTTTDIYSSHGNTAATSINQLQQSQTLSHTNASGREMKNRQNQTTTMKKNSKDVSQNRGTKSICKAEKNDAGANSSNIHDICGLSRGLRKTKDELFNEFCKKAGNRPKPKDIYYIDDPGEHEDEESIYIVDGNYIHQHQQLQNQNQHYQNQLNPHHPTATVQQLRRNSMFVEPSSVQFMLKRNSNLSLHTTDASGGFIEKTYPKGHFELSRCDSEIWNTYPDQYHNRNGMLQDCNVYNSRTLPRSFMKRSTDSQEFLERNTLCGTYPGNRLGHGSRDTIYHSGLALHKSCENVNSLNFTTNQSLGQRKMGNPSTLLALPSKLQSSSQTVQWPAAIPTSPSNFSTKSIRFNSNANGVSTSNTVNTSIGRIAAGHGNRGIVSVVGNIPPTTHHKFLRAYAFDDRKTDAAFESFDLDEMERERRKSHASLFDGSKNGAGGGGGVGLGGFYDMINGTAV